jgi:hypothetical protein
VTAAHWCWTEDEPATLGCRDLDHDVRATEAPAGDPAVAEWAQAVGQSTSARLRAAEAEIDRLRARLGQRDLDELAAYDACWCGTCIYPPTNHPHQIVPVRVTITRRTEGPTT